MHKNPRLNKAILNHQFHAHSLTFSHEWNRIYSIVESFLTILLHFQLFNQFLRFDFLLPYADMHFTPNHCYIYFNKIYFLNCLPYFYSYTSIDYTSYILRLFNYLLLGNNCFACIQSCKFTRTSGIQIYTIYIYTV